jgi:hypothetical protein
MYKSGDKVLIYSGVIDASGTKTDVEIAEIVEVGEFELLIMAQAKYWKRPSRVHKSRCFPLTGDFEQPPPKAVPKIGDLVLVYKFDILEKVLEKTVGPVQTITYDSTETSVVVLINGQLKKIALRDVMILQRNPKIS